jgi:ABC-type phosphate transport system substrate-binding protein
MRRRLVLLLLCIACRANADWLVVVGAESPIDKLSAKQVADIFLARTRSLDAVGRVTPLQLGDDERYDFYQRISSKTPAQINSYWTALIFTGKGKPPKVLRDRGQWLDTLSHDPGAISFLDAGQLNPALKVVYRFE